MKSMKTLAILQCFFIILIGVNACNEDVTSTDSLNCTVEVLECLTNGSSQSYFVYSTDGVITTGNCFLSIRMSLYTDGTFDFTSNGDTDTNCRERVGFDSFTGNWILENNNSEIHITPPWFTDQGQTETVLKIITLSEREFSAETPTQGGLTTKVWRRTIYL